MKNRNQYSGKNPIPGPKRFGNHKDAAPAVVAVDPPANDAVAPVVITSIEPKVDANPDANVVIAAAAKPAVAEECADKPLASAQAKVDALDNVKPGEQILADTTKPAASTRPAS